MSKVYMATCLHISRPFSSRDIAEKNLVVLIRQAADATLSRIKCNDFTDAANQERFGDAIRAWNNAVLSEKFDLKYETYFASIVERNLDEPFFNKT